MMKNTNTNEVLKSLESSYINGQFEGVQNSLLQYKEKFDPQIFHYNLGTVFLQKKQYAIARYHLEKALKLGLKEPFVLDNLYYAKKHLSDTYEEKASGKLQEIENFLFFNNSFLTLELGLLLTLSLFFFLTLIFLYQRKLFKRKNAFLTFILLISFAWLPTLFLWTRGKIFMDGIVIEKSEVREGPSLIYPRTARLPAGMKVVVEKSQMGWAYIRYPLRYRGWVERQKLAYL